jgi:hypothetical protein
LYWTGKKAEKWIFLSPLLFDTVCSTGGRNMLFQNSNNKVWFAGIAASLMIITVAPMAMAWNDDSRSNGRDNGGFVPPYLREKEARNERDNSRDNGIVPPYVRDRVDANRSKGW